MSDNKKCGCGGHNHHEHKEEKGCGCGGHHHHEHKEEKGCGCGGHNHHEHKCCGKHKKEMPTLSNEYKSILIELAEKSYLPLVRFVMKSSKSSHFESVALHPVFLHEASESMEEVKANGKILSEMEELDLITLDYDIPLKNYEYSEFTGSNVYSYFVKTMEESKNKEDFLYDIADLEKGSIAMTDMGHMLFHQIAHE